MSEGRAEQSRPWTWGAFMDHARAFGVSVETMPNVTLRDRTQGAFDYLWRPMGDDELTCPLPMGYHPDRRLGPIALAKACRRLAIPVPQWPEPPRMRGMYQ